MTHVFRNSTAELLFGNAGYSFSGYDEIVYSGDADSFIWFYTVPVHADTQSIATEISSYAERLKFVNSQIPATSQLIVFTLYRLFDFKAESMDFSVESSIDGFNSFILEFAKTNSNVRVIDFSEFCSRYAVTDLIDWKFYFLSQAAINPKLAVAFRKWFELKKSSFSKPAKKCLVLDLDNTLWGGILGEDGPEHLKIGGDYPGKAFLLFQQQILELQKRGIILAICSKNNEADVWEFIGNSRDQVLKKEHIAAWRINWNDKAGNIAELAKELNIGLDSMVFLDDQPAERELVKSMLPEVTVPDFPTAPYLLPVFFKNLQEQYFNIYQASAEDLRKTEQYKQNAERRQLQQQFTNIDDFIKSLQIETTIRLNDPADLPRIAQMSQKTNQFNLTGKRYTDLELREIIEHNGKVFSLSVKDKFGDSGLTGAAIVSLIGNEAHIENLFLSCRILGRKIENTFVEQILLTLREEGFKCVTAIYSKMPKNQSVVNFYESAGFTETNVGETQKTYVYYLK